MSELVFDEDVARQVEAVYHIGDAVRRRGLVRQGVSETEAQAWASEMHERGEFRFACPQYCFTATRA